MYQYQGGYGRQYYFIKSRMNGLVLDVEGGSTSPGSRIITWPKKDSGADNQLWYDDQATGTIRSKLTDFCIDVQGDQLVVNHSTPGDVNQMWERSGQVIKNRGNGKHFDISGGNRDAGAHLVAWDYHGGENQLFDFEYPAAEMYAPPRHFFIVSEMNGKVIDIAGGDTNAGAKVIMYDRNNPPSANQLWYCDIHGYIKSAMNNMAFHSSEYAHQLEMTPFTSDPRQLWRLEGNKIVNGTGQSLDIKGGDSGNGAEVISYEYQGSENQRWRAEYI